MTAIMTKSVSVFLDLSCLVRPQCLASSLLAYCAAGMRPVLGMVEREELGYALSGIASESSSDTYYEAKQALAVLKPVPPVSLRTDQVPRISLSDPQASMVMLDLALKFGFAEGVVGDLFADGYETLTPMLRRVGTPLKGGGELVVVLPDQRNAMEEATDSYMAFFARMRPSAERQTAEFERRCKSTYTLRLALEDSCVRGLGYAASGIGWVATCNTDLWRNLRSAFPNAAPSSFATIDLATVIEASPELFTVRDVFELLRDSSLAERILVARDQQATTLRSSKAVARELGVFLVTELASHVVGPLVTGFEIVKTLFRIRISERRRP